MSAPRTIPDSIRQAQARASAPDTSAFVAANAGSGKTHVLVQRVIRLLLAGAAPSRILCITYTKAAAANMAQRVFDTLGAWIACDDDALDRALNNVGIARPSPSIRKRARELFARALDTPGGLKVQTIHALCTRLLQQFPFEAGVPAHFTVLDERDTMALREKASLAVLLEAATEPDSATGRALAIVMRYAADQTFRDVMQEASAAFSAWAADPAALATLRSRLSAQLGLPENLSQDDVDRAIVDGPLLPIADWRQTASVLRRGSANDQKQAELLETAFKTDGEDRIAAYLEVFFTAGGSGPKRSSVVTKKIHEVDSVLAQTLKDEQERLENLVEQRRGLRIRERTEALLLLAAQVAARYRQAKAQRGALDYDDMIERTRTLLDRVDSKWVHYKLDQGIDHVLIDEAQDTSPSQWEIVTSLISEFTAGEGARPEIKRTLFAVGDDKQSIFSFQGAVTKEFDERRRAFRQMFQQAHLPWDDVRLEYSFRSGEALLTSVSEVFRESHVYRSITADADGMPPHLALADAAPGQVDVWDLIERSASPKIEGWEAPFNATSETSPPVQLARRIAAYLHTLFGNGAATGRGAERRPLRPGDVLILVRKRGPLFEAIIQALKRADIPVAGADRLKLTEHIAVADLMALADAALAPFDDLALATVLKSPLFGLDDDHLFTLAWQRGGRLVDALAQHAARGAPFSEAWTRWQAFAARARTESPFSFFAGVLSHDRGRARFLQRLGPEANDALDEFLDLARAYEQRETASLQGFLGWLRGAEVEIKRDMEIARDEVRVMTVHGAKGLEAPLVLLADTTTSPSAGGRLSLIDMNAGGDASQADPALVWVGKKSDDTSRVAAARQAMQDEEENEYRRLLYVAMTRAMERLVVCGFMPGNTKNPNPNWWYSLITGGLAHASASGTLQESVIATDPIRVRCFTKPGSAPLADTALAGVTDETTPQEPDWLRRHVAAATPQTAALAPSRYDGDDAAAAGRTDRREERRRAQQRGTLVHRLLQSLPTIKPAHRADAARAYLERHAADWSDGERATLATQVTGLIDDPRIAPVFAPGSRAEVPIVARLPREGRAPLLISGQIDRLVRTVEGFLLADFKTNLIPPRSEVEVPPAYRAQMALYREVLRRAVPGATVRSILIWTEGPEIMELSGDALDAELTRILAR